MSLAKYLTFKIISLLSLQVTASLRLLKMSLTLIGCKAVIINKVMNLSKSVQAFYVSKVIKPDNIIIMEVNIDSIPFEQLIKIVKPKKRDPDLFENYALNKRQLQSINNLIKNKIIIDFNLYFYLLAREGEYELE